MKNKLTTAVQDLISTAIVLTEKQDELIATQASLLARQAEKLSAIEAIIGCTYPSLTAGQQAIMQVDMIGLIFAEETEQESVAF